MLLVALGSREPRLDLLLELELSSLAALGGLEARLKRLGEVLELDILFPGSLVEAAVVGDLEGSQTSPVFNVNLHAIDRFG